MLAKIGNRWNGDFCHGVDLGYEDNGLEKMKRIGNPVLLNIRELCGIVWIALDNF